MDFLEILTQSHDGIFKETKSQKALHELPHHVPRKASTKYFNVIENFKEGFARICHTNFDANFMKESTPLDVKLILSCN